MKKYDLITPEGTRDLLFDESVARRTAEARLRDIFIHNGYSEVITPELEFFDVFSKKGRYFAQESMYKLTDSKGRLLVLRADNTLPIARLVATRLRDGVFPLKLFYSQNIFRANPKNSGRDDMIAQSGVEIIGGDVRRSDLESLSLALDVLKSFNETDFRFEIGDTAFFRQLMLAIDPKNEISDELYEEIGTAISGKNYHELSRLLGGFDNTPAVKALKELPHLFGGKEVFSRAEKVFGGAAEKEALAELAAVYSDLSKLGIADKITVDLGMASKTEYYTGIMFKGYVEGFGMPVLSGGRYDKLIGDFGTDIPATGFAVNVNALAELLLRRTNSLLKTPDVLVFAESTCMVEAIEYSKKLISEGLIVESAVISTLEQAKDYAKHRGIPRIDIVGEEQNKSIRL